MFLAPTMEKPEENHCFWPHPRIGQTIGVRKVFCQILISGLRSRAETEIFGTNSPRYICLDPEFGLIPPISAEIATDCFAIFL